MGIHNIDPLVASNSGEGTIDDITSVSRRRLRSDRDHLLTQIRADRQDSNHHEDPLVFCTARLNHILNGTVQQ